MGGVWAAVAGAYVSLPPISSRTPIHFVRHPGQKDCSPDNLRVPNGVFQTVFFGFLASAFDRGRPLQRDKECLQMPMFSSVLVPSALADPDPPSELTTLKNTI